jgi:hypothetical protein
MMPGGRAGKPSASAKEGIIAKEAITMDSALGMANATVGRSPEI